MFNHWFRHSALDELFQQGAIWLPVSHQNIAKRPEYKFYKTKDHRKEIKSERSHSRKMVVNTGL